MTGKSFIFNFLSQEYYKIIKIMIYILNKNTFFELNIDIFVFLV